MAHLPFAHEPAHTLPQAPQFASSLETSVHVVPQAVFELSAHTHVPPLQDASVGQACPHAPQFSESIVRSVQTSSSVAVHRVCPEAQRGAHFPPVQASDGLHGVSHDPQWSGSTFGSTHDWPHWVVPGPQLVAQAPW